MLLFLSLLSLAWVQAMEGAIAGALSGVDASRVLAVAVSGQQHGLVVVDAQGAVVRPAKLWCDVEALAEAAELSALLGVCIPAGFTAPKILWLKRHEPEHFAQAAHVLLPHDYVNKALTGVAVCEASDASGTGLFHSSTRLFDAQRCAAVDPRLLGPSADVRGGGGLLPKLVPPDQAIGAVTAQAAARFGLPVGCLVAPGGGDNAMSALGVGAVVPGGVLVCSLGTSGCLFCCASQPVLDPSGCVAPFCDAAGAALPLLCTQNCTGPASELRAAFSLSHAQAEQLAIAAGVPADASQAPLFLPYLSGERTPNWPHATAALLNLRPGSLANPGGLYRSAIEGAAFALRDGYERMRACGVPAATQLLLVGGAAESPLWASVVAGAFQLPVRTAGETEAAALGAALQAAAVSAGQPVAAYVRQHAPQPRDDAVLPQPQQAGYYADALQRFQAAGSALFGAARV